MKCASCGKRSAPIHPSFGPLWCKKCQKKYEPMSKKPWPEFVPDYIKEDRLKNAKDIVQPWRQGEPSREFIKLYPEKAKKTFTPEQIRTAKDTWRDLKGLRNIQEVR